MGYLMATIRVNCRTTLAAVTDQANAVHSGGAAYTTGPVGWLANAVADSRDIGQSSHSVSLYGFIFAPAGGSKTLKVTPTDGPGTYKVRCALGRGDGSPGLQTLVLKDGATTLATISGTPTIDLGAGAGWNVYIDATNTERSGGTSGLNLWEGQQGFITVTLTGNTFEAVIGNATGTTCLAALEFEFVPGAPPPPPTGGVTFTGTVPAQGGVAGQPFVWTGAPLSSYYTGTGTYAQVSNTLAALGLTLDPNTAVVSGTCIAGSASTTVRKTAASGSPPTADSNAIPFTIATTPPPPPPATGGGPVVQAFGRVPRKLSRVIDVTGGSGALTDLVIGAEYTASIQGGGGGGGSTAGGVGAGGGSAGAMLELYFVASSSDLSYSVGAGGQGASSSGSAGADGQPTTLGAYLAPGGKGGSQSVTGGALVALPAGALGIVGAGGGDGGNGAPGQRGGAPGYPKTVGGSAGGAGNNSGGGGGASLYGAGGIGGAGTASGAGGAGANGVAPGAGGGGGGSGSTSQGVGGNGQSGMIRLEEFLGSGQPLDPVL